MSSFEDRVASVVQGILSDSTQLPAEFVSSLPQIVAQNPVALAKASGDRLAYQNSSSTVSTTGTTFATGADVLASDLTFTATGNNDYILRVSGSNWSSSPVNQIQLHLNLDGSDGGIFNYATPSTAGFPLALNAVGLISKPVEGEHTVNARLVTAGGTASIQAGGSALGIVVTLEVA